MSQDPFDAALDAHRAGRLDTALKLYRKAEKLRPRDPRVVGNIGLVHYQAGRHAEAIAKLRAALSLAPGDHGLLLNLGNCLEVEGFRDEALACFTQAAAGNNFPEANYNLGNALALRGHRAQAIEQYRRVLALRPGHVKARRRLALVLAGEGIAGDDGGQLREASDLLDALLASGAADGEVRAVRARCAWRLAWMGQEIEPMRAAVRALVDLGDADAVRAREGIARLALDRGDTAAAIVASGEASPPPDGWMLRVVRRSSSSWSVDRPLGTSEERDGVLLTGMRDWLVLRGDGTLRFEDMTNANPEAGQFVRAIVPSGRILLAAPRECRNAIDEAVLIGGSDNYYHWMLDHLPRLRLVGGEALPLAVNRDLVPFQRETMTTLGIGDGRLLPLPSGQAVAFRRLVVPDLGTVAKRPHPDTVSWLRATFGPRTPGRDIRLLISRADAALRRVANEDELAAALEPHGFRRVVPGGMSVREQAALFAAAEVVVAPHGAALANLVFCRAGTQVFELMPGHHRQLGFFPDLSAACGLAHERLVCEPSPTAEQIQSTPAQNYDFRVPAEVVRRILAQLR